MPPDNRPIHGYAGIRTSPQSNMPIKGNPLKTSFQDLELTVRDYIKTKGSIAL